MDSFCHGIRDAENLFIINFNVDIGTQMILALQQTSILANKILQQAQKTVA